jgi:hypothetical protein
VAERVEYDVAVNLKVNAGKSGFAGKAMANEAAAAEKERRRAMERAGREYARRMEREKKLREREAEAAKKAKAQWWGTARKGTADNVSGMTGGIAGAFKSVGTGPAVEWAKTAAVAAGLVFAGAFGVAAGKGLVGGVQENAKAESSQNRIGTTLQLFDFNADKGGEQYVRNLADATWYSNELVRIADAAPGDIGQVEGLFQNLLPGMASITQDAKEITDLTQKATLLSAVLGNRFELVGEQSSRMLTGGAGAEMDTWRLLQKPILEAGKKLEVFKDSQGMGEKLTQAFNKLDPQKRLEVFKAGLSRLGDEVAEQYANSWEGITSQAISSGKALRRVLGKDTFDELKRGLKGITQDGGPLDSKGPQFRQLKEFMAVLGDSAGWATHKAMNVARDATSYVADNWQTIVMRAQEAAHYLVSGAKLAAGLSAARLGAGVGLGLAGFGLDAMKGIGSAVSGVVSMGSAALVAAPALLLVGAAAAGLGIVALGAGLMFGGVVTYLVSNLDELGAAIRDGSVSIQPFLTAVDDLGAKFYALGGYLLGASDGSTGFQTAVDFATGVVHGVTEAFGYLLDATAWVLDAFASLVEFADNLNPKSTVRELMAAAGGTEVEGGIAAGARGMADTVRGAADAFRKAKADPFNAAVPSLSEAAYNRLYPMGPELPPPGGSANNKKPPKVEAKVTIYNQMNLREMDPNAVVAAFNRVTSQKIAVPLTAAMRRAGMG